MTKRCKGCNGQFVSREFPYCQRCDEERYERKRQQELNRWREDKAREAQWAREILDLNPLILDTETTGLDGYIVQIAVIDSADQVLLDTLVNPMAEIEEGAMAVHGITQATVAGAPTFAEISAKLHALLKGHVVIVYNLPFDYGILLDERKRMGHDKVSKKTMYGARWEDLMLPYSAYVGDIRNDGEYRWQRLPGGDHSAAGDCSAALAVLKDMAASS